MTKLVPPNQLLLLASDSQSARLYHTFETFYSEINSTIFDTCQIPLLVPTSGNETQNLTLQAVSVNETRHLKVLIDPYFTKVEMVVEVENLFTTVFVSFTQPFPSEVDHELKEEVELGNPATLLVVDYQG